MAKMSEQFELDRGNTGGIKVNVISIANLVALLGLIFLAAQTWNGLAGRVDILNTRVETSQRELSQIRTELQSSVMLRAADSKDLRDKIDNIGNRMTAVETVLQRVERKIEPR